MSPKAGQVYQAKARRGTRLIKIEQVRGRGEGVAAYALAREVLPSGAYTSGWLHGVPRDGVIRIQLIYAQGKLQMPPWYVLQELES